MLRTCSLVFLLGCVSPSSSREPTGNCGEDVRGERSQMTTPVAAPAGPTIEEPKVCEDHGGPGAYIRVQGHGTRPIEMGREAQTRCTAGSSCVFADDFGRAVIARLGEQKIETIGLGLGLGVCGETGGNYDAWNMSISVLDWKHVDAAIAAVDAELRARDVSNSFGVSVRGVVCAVAE